MKASDVIPALVLLALSALVVLGTLDLGLWDEITPGPAFFPALIGAVGAVLVLLRLVEARRSGAGAAVAWPDRATLLRLAATFAALVAFALLSPYLGMVPVAALLVAFLLVVVLGRPVGASLAASAITTGVIYAVFVLWLGLRLPTGVFGI